MRMGIEEMENKDIEELKKELLDLKTTILKYVRHHIDALNDTLLKINAINEKTTVVLLEHENRFEKFESENSIEQLHHFKKLDEIHHDIIVERKEFNSLIISMQNRIDAFEYRLEKIQNENKISSTILKITRPLLFVLGMAVLILVLVNSMKIESHKFHLGDAKAIEEPTP